MPEAAIKDPPRGLPGLTFTQESTVRLISTAYIREPAMGPLADDAASLAVLERLEALTSRRQDHGMPLPAGLKRSELLTASSGYGYTYVNAAFCYTRPTGNRFNGPERGAWYACWGDAMSETAQAEVGWHLTRELENTGIFENVTDYRELIAGFTAQMIDLRHCPGAPFLDPDPAISYGEGQRLAREVLEAGYAGLLYPSMRRPGGLCLAALRPHTVQNIRQGATWRFTWSGRPEPAIEKI